MRTIVIIISIFLSGCIADNNSRLEKGNQEDKITINVPDVPIGKVVDDVSSRVKAEMANNNSQMSGQINGMIHQIKTDIGKVFEKMFEVNTKINTEFNSTIQGLMKINTELRAEVNIKGSLIEKLSIENAEIKTKFNAQAQMAANAQIGKNNFKQSIKELKQTFDSKAGRDVNMLPQQAVDIIIDSWKTFSAILAGIGSIIVTIITLLLRNSRIRAEQRYQLEKQQSNKMFKLLTQALLHVPPTEAEKVRAEYESST